MTVTAKGTVTYFHRAVSFFTTDKELAEPEYDNGTLGIAVSELDDLSSNGWEIVTVRFERMRLKDDGTWGWTGVALVRRPSEDEEG